MKAQISLTVKEAKYIIAMAISQRNDVLSAKKSGKIILKGGTTVSALAQLWGMPPIRISGRIMPRGTVSSLNNIKEAHSVLIENDITQDIDEIFPDIIPKLDANDIVIIGANAIDTEKNAAILIGSPMGGKLGMALAGLMSQGCKIIIACGLEKLIPGSIKDAIKISGISVSSYSLGMSCGLVPIIGEVVTEQDAINTLFGIHSHVISCGGIAGAEGATTMIIEGSNRQISTAFFTIAQIKTYCKHIQLGNTDSIIECHAGSPGCKIHKKCAYRKGEIHLDY